MIPNGLKAISDYLVAAILGEKKNTSPRLPPPSLLSGPRGTGKSWILSEVKSRVAERADETGIYPVEIPWSLSAETLIESIQQKIEEAKMKKSGLGLLSRNNSPEKFLLLIEEIDSFFRPHRIDAPFKKPSRSKGVGAAIFSQIKNASRLRSFLIERHDSVSILATASSDLRFLQDPDLPFFQFFNVINVSPLNEEQTLLQIKNKIPKDFKFSALVDSLNRLSPFFYQKITDGKILYINAFVDSILDLTTDDIDLRQSADDIILLFLSHFFHRLDPYMASVLESLSGLERQLVDHAILLGQEFKASDLSHLSTPDVVRILHRLVDKDILIKTQGKRGRFQFSSNAMKSFLRFRRRLTPLNILAPNLPIS